MKRSLMMVVTVLLAAQVTVTALACGGCGDDKHKPTMVLSCEGCDSGSDNTDKKS